MQAYNLQCIPAIIGLSRRRLVWTGKLLVYWGLSMRRNDWHTCFAVAAASVNVVVLAPATNFAFASGGRLVSRRPPRYVAAQRSNLASRASL
ncbi:hypothetical protein L596_021226 [Steinernema carpocapsae]|uniref:Uncharacterized protein n=1 Tax=Steinernema carpocapsae TaxID=34508 RepID=A0A4U5MVX8_STECR|nr:hypothetical protein L596_021226 [Steinernema carpocapsae]